MQGAHNYLNQLNGLKVCQKHSCTSVHAVSLKRVMSALSLKFVTQTVSIYLFLFMLIILEVFHGQKIQAISSVTSICSTTYFSFQEKINVSFVSCKRTFSFC